MKKECGTMEWPQRMHLQTIVFCVFLLVCKVVHFKVGTSGYGNLQTMNTDKWATSKSTQLSTKIWVKLLLLLENALKLDFEAL